MHYAVTLEFDKETENRIQQMIDEVAKKTGCNHMKQYGIPPHITVSGLISENEEAFSIVQEKFSAFGAVAERITPARCEPYEELKSWILP